MQEATDAYTKVGKITRTPRDLEASLLLKAASQLQTIKDNWGSENEKLEEALLYNRKLWTIFMSTITQADNPMPIEVKNNIASLGAFVLHQTLVVQNGPVTSEMLTSLININRELAAGLHASTG